MQSDRTADPAPEAGVTLGATVGAGPPGSGVGVAGGGAGRDVGVAGPMGPSAEPETMRFTNGSLELGGS